MIVCFKFFYVTKIDSHDYISIAIRLKFCYSEEKFPGFKLQISVATLTTVTDHSFLVFSGYSRSLTISPFLPKFRQMPTFSPML